MRNSLKVGLTLSLALSSLLYGTDVSVNPGTPGSFYNSYIKNIKDIGEVFLLEGDNNTIT